jgi:uncharacterized membrane protein YuzA (DUF378 family)
MLQVFFILFTLIASTKAFANFDRAFALIIYIILGFTGIIALVTFLIDIQANTSTKTALRRRGAEIEQQLCNPNLQHWATISTRDKFCQKGDTSGWRGGSS